MPTYTEGICGDGAAILKDGELMTIDQVLQELNEAQDRSGSEGPSEADCYAPNFELVQLHECKTYAEVVVRDAKNKVVYAGNIQKVNSPDAYI